MSGQSIRGLDEIGARPLARLQATGLRSWQQVEAGDCHAFVTTRTWTSPKAATQHLRRSAVGVVFRTLRVLDLLTGDPISDLVLPPREARAYRPLTDDEVVLCRGSTRLGASGTRSLRRATAWALGEATAATSEIGGVRVADLDHPAPPPGAADCFTPLQRPHR